MDWNTIAKNQMDAHPNIGIQQGEAMKHHDLMLNRIASLGAMAEGLRAVAEEVAERTLGAFPKCGEAAEKSPAPNDGSVGDILRQIAALEWTLNRIADELERLRAL